MDSKFSKDNPPASDDYSPEAIHFRESQAEPEEPDELSQSTDHEQHGGVAPLSEEQQQEKPGAEPAPRHYD